MNLPTQLAAPAVSWTREVDVVVLGSGAAGLAAALAARPVRDVLIITKDTLDAGSTAWAQGGLAAVLDPADTFGEHVRDTLEAGAGLCDEAAVTSLVRDAPTAIQYLEKLGAAFDPGSDGLRALTREGGHSRSRIVHAGGDQSGAEVQRTLDMNAINAGVEVMDHAFALDLVFGKSTGGRRRIAGVRIAKLDAQGNVESVGLVKAPAVVIATGGYGQVFASTSNPPAVTGDGHALALRAGLTLRDLEFVQFHPTVLWHSASSTQQQMLISEAVRGEGAYLLNDAGERFMQGQHEMAELAPRDVVAIAIMREMNRTGAHHVWLDVRHLTGFKERFPTIYASCIAHGIDPTNALIPVAPASHYASGGVRVDLDGRTSVKGLYACGETACSGVHGANRLASNSLLEGLVFSARIAADISNHLPEFSEPVANNSAEFLLDPSVRKTLQESMSRGAGVLRSADSLIATSSDLSRLESRTSTVACVEAWETTNLFQLANTILRAALIRQETRGSHWREDFPHQSNDWHKRIVQQMDQSGQWRTEYQEVNR